jgi:Co/Zn/Cd efflux system component
MDPLISIVGALLVARWSLGLMVSTATVLLDHQAPNTLEQRIRKHLAGNDGTEIEDLHVWSIGPGIYALIAVVTSGNPLTADAYRDRLPPGLGLVHATIEVRPPTGPTAVRS